MKILHLDRELASLCLSEQYGDIDAGIIDVLIQCSRSEYLVSARDHYPPTEMRDPCWRAKSSKTSFLKRVWGGNWPSSITFTSSNCVFNAA